MFLRNILLFTLVFTAYVLADPDETTEPKAATHDETVNTENTPSSGTEEKKEEKVPEEKKEEKKEEKEAEEKKEEKKDDKGTEEKKEEKETEEKKEEKGTDEKREENTSDEKKTPKEKTTESNEVTKAELPLETVSPTNTGVEGLGKLADLLHIENKPKDGSEVSNDEVKEKLSKSSDREQKTNDGTQTNDQVPADSSGEHKESKSSVEKTDNVSKKSDSDVSPVEPSTIEVTEKKEKIEVKTKEINVSPNVEVKPNVGTMSIIKPKEVKDSENNGGQHIDAPPHVAYNAGLPKAPAEHKMTFDEQNGYICGLKLEGELCPMTINLDENVGISDPGANAYCNDVIAAPMGYKGFCVVLMKMNPENDTPIYTRTCAFYDKDKDKSKCGTTFLTTQPQTNSTQVKYRCDNGIIHYIPTSCCKKSHIIQV